MDLFVMTVTCKQNWNNLQTSLVFTFKAGQRSSCLQMASQLSFLEKCNSQEKIKGPLYGADQILEKVRILSSPLLKTFTLALCQGTVPMLPAKSSKVPPHPPLDVQTTIPCWEFIWMATDFWWFPPQISCTYAYKWGFVGGELSPHIHLAPTKTSLCSLFEYSPLLLPKIIPHILSNGITERENLAREQLGSATTHSNYLVWELLAKCYRNIIIRIY